MNTGQIQVELLTFKVQIDYFSALENTQFLRQDFGK